MSIGERIRSVTEQTLSLPDGMTNTVSIGATEIIPLEFFEDALKRVDEALYTAKLTGKKK